jgi:hypothetical protein
MKISEQKLTNWVLVACAIAIIVAIAWAAPAWLEWFHVDR